MRSVDSVLKKCVVARVPPQPSTMCAMGVEKVFFIKEYHKDLHLCHYGTLGRPGLSTHSQAVVKVLQALIVLPG